MCFQGVSIRFWHDFVAQNSAELAWLSTDAVLEQASVNEAQEAQRIFVNLVFRNCVWSSSGSLT